MGLESRWESKVKGLLREVMELADRERVLWPVGTWARWSLEHGQIAVRELDQMIGYLNCLIWNGLRAYEQALVIREKLWALRRSLHWGYGEGQVGFEGDSVVKFWCGG